MIHDAVDFGREVRKQYVPRHVQVPETKMDAEILNPEDNNLATVAFSKNATAAAITESESGSCNPTAQPL